jgi:hypothetical protein
MSTAKPQYHSDPKVNIGKYGIDLSTGLKCRVKRLIPEPGKTMVYGSKSVDDCYEVIIVGQLPQYYSPVIPAIELIGYCLIECFKPFNNQEVFELLYADR